MKDMRRIDTLAQSQNKSRRHVATKAESEFKLQELMSFVHKDKDQSR